MTKMFNIYSAVFGTEIWPAAEYGRTMYTIRQRIGPLLMRMQKRYGWFIMYACIFAMCSPSASLDSSHL